MDIKKENIINEAELRADTMEIELRDGETYDEAIMREFGLERTPPDEMPDDEDIEGMTIINFKRK